MEQFQLLSRNSVIIALYFSKFHPLFSTHVAQETKMIQSTDIVPTTMFSFYLKFLRSALWRNNILHECYQRYNWRETHRNDERSLARVKFFQRAFREFFNCKVISPRTLWLFPYSPLNVFQAINLKCILYCTYPRIPCVFSFVTCCTKFHLRGLYNPSLVNLLLNFKKIVFLRKRQK